MPSTEKHSSFVRSILSIRRDQVHIEENQESSPQEMELEAFQNQVTDRFNNLAAEDPGELLSLKWITKLLDAFLCCQEEFSLILVNNKALVSEPPLDRFVAEFFDRSLKALDICNATRDGLEKIRQWENILEIVLCALDSKQRALGEAQCRRARKCLTDLAISMLDEKDCGSMFSHRNRSFGRQNTSKDHHHNIQSNRPGHSRSLSWSVSRSWSAAKQLQSIANNLVPPRGADVAATRGLAIPVFTMSSVLMFVLWALVASFPCQDRGIQTHFTVPRQFSWGIPISSLHERIIEESKKREKRNSNGLLKEISKIERAVRHVTELVDAPNIPLTEEVKTEIERDVDELSDVCQVFKNGLDPLERQLREVFRRIMSFRNEGLEFLGRASNTD